MKRMTTLLGSLVAAAMLLAGLMLAATPDVGAHTPGESYTHDSVIATDCSNIPGWSTIGTSGGSFICRPTGYVPLGNAPAECATVGFGARMVQGVCSFSADERPCGTVLFTRYYGVPTSGGLCVWGVLHVPDVVPAATNTGLPYATQICVEDDLVQKHAQGLSVGARFFHDSVEYEIVTGGTFCSFNCAGGYDINCDGKLGDFCAIELDLSKVSDVATCLDSSAFA